MMTLDHIRHELRTNPGIPAEALRAAVPHADVLATEVYAVADKFRRGVWLMPHDDKLLFHGLHVLAAAKHPGLLNCILSLLRRHDGDLDHLFSDDAVYSLIQLFRSVWYGDPAELFIMLEHADLTESGREALFYLIARLTFERRIPREMTEQFLERFERDGLAADEDDTWWSWEDAVTRLGFVSLEPALQRVWAKPAFAHHNERDRAESLEELRTAAQNPADPKPFDGEDLGPIADPVDALAWITKRDEALARWRAERGEQAETKTEDNDPAKSVRLTRDELHWLEGFLESGSVPDTTMPLEMLDGFFTALVIGPTMVPPSEYLKVVWGTEDGSGPHWDDIEQANYVLGLLTKHWNAITARRSASVPIEPWMDVLRNDAVRGMMWTDGFEVGIGLRDRAWEAGFEMRNFREMVFAILDLNRRTGDAGGSPPLRPNERAKILTLLPKLLQRISEFWKDPFAISSAQQPVRSTKVGRNEPCTCGSRKKYKKCCGGVATVH